MLVVIFGKCQQNHYAKKHSATTKRTFTVRTYKSIYADRSYMVRTCQWEDYGMTKPSPQLTGASPSLHQFNNIEHTRKRTFNTHTAAADCTTLFWNASKTNGNLIQSVFNRPASAWAFSGCVTGFWLYTADIWEHCDESAGDMRGTPERMYTQQ